MKRSKTAGFTLIELMITVVIIGILAAIAYPSYQEQVRKTRRAEGQAALMVAVQRLERCFTLYNVYDNSGDAADDATCPEGAAFDSEGGWYTIDFADGEPTATTFTLEAVPNNDQANDARCATLTIDQAGSKNHTGDAANALDCW